MLSDEEAADFWAVYRKTSEGLFRKAYRMCHGHQADAEDALQRTYLKALERWAVFGGLAERQRHAWLATTLAREVLQFWRLPYRSREAEAGSDARRPVAAAGGADAVEALATADRYRRACRAIASLEGRQREVIALRCLAGYEIAEVAEMLGITAQTVRVHLHDGRRRLRDMLAGEEEGADDRG